MKLTVIQSTYLFIYLPTYLFTHSYTYLFYKPQYGVLMDFWSEYQFSILVLLVEKLFFLHLLSVDNRICPLMDTLRNSSKHNLSSFLGTSTKIYQINPQTVMIEYFNLMVILIIKNSNLCIPTKWEQLICICSFCDSVKMSLTWLVEQGKMFFPPSNSSKNLQGCRISALLQSDVEPVRMSSYFEKQFSMTDD